MPWAPGRVQHVWFWAAGSGAGGLPRACSGSLLTLGPGQSPAVWGAGLFPLEGAPRHRQAQSTGGGSGRSGRGANAGDRGDTPLGEPARRGHRRQLVTGHLDLRKPLLSTPPGPRDAGPSPDPWPRPCSKEPLPSPCDSAWCNLMCPRTLTPVSAPMLCRAGGHGEPARGPAGARVSRGVHLPGLGARSPMWGTLPPAEWWQHQVLRLTPWVHRRQAESAWSSMGVARSIPLLGHSVSPEGGGRCPSQPSRKRVWRRRRV